MKKSYLTAVFMLMCLLGVGVSARAQDADAVVVSVPFEFVAGGATLPAGEYRVSRINPGINRELVISGYNKGSAFLLPLTFDEAAAASGQPTLSFEHVGGKYFLRQDQNTERRLYHAGLSRDGSCLARRPLQPRALHPPLAASKSELRCRAHAVAAEMSRRRKYQSDSRFSVQLVCLTTNHYSEFVVVRIQHSYLLEHTMKKAISFIGLLMTLAIPSGLLAQQAGYSQTNLVSNVAGVGATTDSQLLNPWGISVLPGQDFWIANNNSGTSTLYDQNGNKDAGLVVTIPGASHNPNGNCSPGCPTGTVANASGSYFSGGSFIFDTEDGLIVYWNGSSNTAIVGKDNSASGAVYKGLAILGTNLLAANFNSGKVDVYDSNYNLSSLGGSFTDPNLPVGLAPHGIHVIGNQVYVAYAMQDGSKHDAVPGAGAGQVDIFDTNGNFVSTLVAAGTNNNLNAPWGVVVAPASFGTFAERHPGRKLR